MNKIEEIVARYGCAIVSENTLRDEDLIPAYINALDELGHSSLANGLRGDYIAGTDNTLLIEDLYMFLNQYAPYGFCFGAHPGDGACFGFWKMDDEEKDGE